MSKNLNELLNESDTIEKLNYESLKELWVKQFLWQGYRKRLLKKSGNPLMTDKYDENLKLLKDYQANYGIGRFILDNNEFKQSVKQLVSNNSDNVVETLFNEYTKSYMNKQDKIDSIKDKLKGLLNGSCGMPAHKILRGSIENCLARQDLEN